MESCARPRETEAAHLSPSGRRPGDRGAGRKRRALGLVLPVYALERPQTDAAALSASGTARGRRRLRGVPHLLQRSADRAGGSGRGDVNSASWHSADDDGRSSRACERTRCNRGSCMCCRCCGCSDGGQLGDVHTASSTKSSAPCRLNCCICIGVRPPLARLLAGVGANPLE